MFFETFAFQVMQILEQKHEYVSHEFSLSANWEYGFILHFSMFCKILDHKDIT